MPVIPERDHAVMAVIRRARSLPCVSVGWAYDLSPAETRRALERWGWIYRRSISSTWMPFRRLVLRGDMVDPSSLLGGNRTRRPSPDGYDLCRVTERGLGRLRYILERAPYSDGALQLISDAEFLCFETMETPNA